MLKFNTFKKVVNKWKGQLVDTAYNKINKWLQDTSK